MCLTYVFNKKQTNEFTKTMKENPKIPSTYIGWKIVKIRNEKIKPYFFPVIGKSFPIAKWIDEEDYRPKGDGISTGAAKIIQYWINTRKSSYGKGFHIYPSLEAALSASVQLIYNGNESRYAKIIKVYYKNVIACGSQNKQSVVVAKSMYIPKQEWKKVSWTEEITE